MSTRRGPTSPRSDRQIPTRPDHLVVWLGGTGADADPPVVDDDLLDDGFVLADWAEDVRAAYPAAVLGVTFAGRSVDDPGDDWLALCGTAAELVDPGDGRSFTGDTTPTSLRAMRDWARSRLTGALGVHDVLTVDHAVLVVSELVTNVERHSSGWLTVDLTHVGDELLLGVTDPGIDVLPAPRPVGPEEVSGRGLLVVTRLARRWGVVVGPHSKTVWVVLVAGERSSATDGLVP